MLDSPDLAAIGSSQYDLAVIDYSADGSAAAAFTHDQIAALKASTGGKVVLAYLSIGEAEDYRFYWELENGSPGGDWRARPPAWLGPENPDFPGNSGNYKARYWDPEWQEIIIANPGGHPVLGGEESYLDRLVAAGFDGVFLDMLLRPGRGPGVGGVHRAARPRPPRHHPGSRPGLAAPRTRAS